MTTVPATTEDVTLRDRVESLVRSRLGIVAFVVAVFLLPVYINTALATEMLILGLFALSYNLMFGFTGLLSFGHALFLGVGAYLAAMVVIELGLPIVAILAIALVVGLGLAFVVGVLSLRLEGVYFAMVTLAFAQLGYELAFFFDDITGGRNGLFGIERTSPFGMNLMDLGTQLSFYRFTALVVIVFLVFVYMLSNSMFGRTLWAIKENEERTRVLGVNTHRVKIVVFTIAGGMAAVAGALQTFYIRFINPEILWWTHTGDAIFYTLIGGFESLLGPLLGAAFLHGADRVLFPKQEGVWRVVMGSVFVLMVLFARGGIVGIVTGAVDRLTGLVGGDGETPQGQTGDD